MKTISNATVAAIGAWTSSATKADKAKTKAVDALWADGVVASMLEAPKKGEATTLYDSVKVGIVMGFGAAIQSLLKKETKTLSDKEKTDKRYWQQQIGSKLKDLRNALARREAEATGSDGAEENKSSWESTKRKVISEIITQAQKKEASTISNMAEFIKDLQNALARIPANA
jgi:hypothetical protein